MSSLIRKISLVAAIGTLVTLGIRDPAFAQRRGGGFRGGGGGMRGGGGFSRGGMSRGGGFARSSARPSVTRPAFGGGGFSRAAARPSTARTIANRPGAVGGNNNVVRRGNAIGNGNNRIYNNRPINVGDVDINGGYGWGGYYGYGYHPVARGAAFAAGAAVTAAAIGSTVYSLPSGCTTTVVNGVTYTQCGSTWYQPQFDGETTTYVVVNAPQ